MAFQRLFSVLSGTLNTSQHHMVIRTSDDSRKTGSNLLLESLLSKGNLSRMHETLHCGYENITKLQLEPQKHQDPKTKSSSHSPQAVHIFDPPAKQPPRPLLASQSSRAKAARDPSVGTWSDRTSPRWRLEQAWENRLVLDSLRRRVT